MSSIHPFDWVVEQISDVVETKVLRTFAQTCSSEIAGGAVVKPLLYPKRSPMVPRDLCTASHKYEPILCINVALVDCELAFCLTVRIRRARGIGSVT